MRISDRAISWDDFDGAPMANLPAQFKMVEIERYTGIGCPKIHFRLYSIVMRAHGQLVFNTVIDVSRRKLEALRQEPEESTLHGIEEGITRGFWLESCPSDSKGKKPSRGQRPEDVGTISSYRPPRSMTPTYLHPTLEPIFAAQGPGHDTDHCTALRHAIQDLIDQDFVEDDSIHMLSWDDGLPGPIVLDDGYEVDIVGSQTYASFSLISNWVPFELTLTTPLDTARQSPPVPFILWLEDDDS
ncbi:hypothetical protein CK203_045918 [Vitis vinifera]|nr:hypothetical protein CK203_045918 [Vitis vinifera]